MTDACTMVSTLSLENWQEKNCEETKRKIVHASLWLLVGEHCGSGEGLCLDVMLGDQRYCQARLQVFHQRNEMIESKVLSLYRRIKHFQIIFEFFFSMLSFLQKYKQPKKTTSKYFPVVKYTVYIIKWICLKCYVFFMLWSYCMLMFIEYRIKKL